jgi:hypothetical protein
MCFTERPLLLCGEGDCRTRWALGNGGGGANVGGGKGRGLLWPRSLPLLSLYLGLREKQQVWKEDAGV